MDLMKALGELAEAPGPEQIRTARLLGLPGEPARAEYTDLFVVQLYPYASVYLSDVGQLGGEVQDHIGGFWRILKQPVPRDPDHVATLFSTYAQLTQRVQNGAEPYLQELARQMRHAFLWEHIISWILPFTARVRELGSATYRGWATLVLDALEAEAVQAGQPALLPLHLRKAPPLPAVPHLSELVETLFTPARSGVILTRADITRCARDLGIQTRVAERRYTLTTLFTQEPARVRQWLASEARRQADQIHGTAEPFRMIADHWEQRALATANLIANATAIENEVRGVQS
jgi:TorA maturation chaperone TorD